MRPFNLAQSKILESSYCRHYLDRRIRSIALIVGLTVLLAAGSSALRTTIRSRASHVRQDLANTQASLTQASHETAAAEARSREQSWLEQLADGSGRWMNVLDSVLQCVPADVWLSRVQTSDKSQVVSVDGAVASYKSLSAFSSRLRRCPTFTDVRLCSTRVDNAEGPQIISFSVELQTRSASERTRPGQTPQPGRVPKVGETF
jgi:Tfp pilus assembly protein PilN